MSTSTVLKTVTINGRTLQVPEFIIDLTTPPSSPELTDSDSEADSESDSGSNIEELSLEESNTSTDHTDHTTLGSDTADQQVSEPALQDEPSELGKLINTWEKAKEARASVDQISKDRCAVLNHLHHQAITLADLRLLVPRLFPDHGLMNKLANNIAYHSSRGIISPADKEAMLMYILTADSNTGYRESKAFWRYEFQTAPQLRVYNIVHEKLKQFKDLAAERGHKKTQGHDVQHNVEAEQQEKHAREIAKFPPRLRLRPENPDLLPLGATSMAQMYVEIMDLTWDDVRKMSRTRAPIKAAVPLLKPAEPTLKDTMRFFATTKPIFTYVIAAKKDARVNFPPKPKGKEPAKQGGNDGGGLTDQDRETTLKCEWASEFISTKRIFDCLHFKKKGNKRVAKVKMAKFTGG